MVWVAEGNTVVGLATLGDVRLLKLVLLARQQPGNTGNYPHHHHGVLSCAVLDYFYPAIYSYKHRN